MIGYLEGKVIFSDGLESLILLKNGVGYQVSTAQILMENTEVRLFIAHVIKEAAQELYGFLTLKEKKMFELLTGVKGIGPKSSFQLVASIGVEAIIQAIRYEDKKALSKAPGVGPKAAAQIILDLSGKLDKINLFQDLSGSVEVQGEIEMKKTSSLPVVDHTLLRDAILACQALGFEEDQIVPIARRLLEENKFEKSEELVHQVLKEV